MGFPVILTPQSEDDLAHIVRYIAKDNPDHAKAFGNFLIDKAAPSGLCLKEDASSRS